MNERKILLFILFAIVYCCYSVHVWFTKYVNEEKVEIQEIKIQIDSVPDIPEVITKNETEEKDRIKSKSIPLFLKNACSVLQIFTEKPSEKLKNNKPEGMDSGNNTITVIGITVFLVILALNAILDVVKVKEEERARRKLNPEGERRQSLSEFANKKTLRRESSKFGLQLFQITECVFNSDEEKKSRRETRPYRRGESTNSYLSEKKIQADGSAPASTSDTPAPDRLSKRQSVAKLFGGRPVPMVRRSSFPALPLNPEVQAIMLGHRQPSFDSDDEGDGKGRRVRIIRRF